MAGFRICLWFWIWHCSEYARVLHRVLNMHEYVQIIPEYAWLCLNIWEYAWICPHLPEWLVISCLHRGYFKNWRQCPAEIWKTFFSLIKGTSDSSYLHVHNIFTLLLIKQIKKKSRAVSKSLMQYWPRITPATWTCGYLFQWSL